MSMRGVGHIAHCTMFKLGAIRQPARISLGHWTGPLNGWGLAAAEVYKVPV